MVVLSPSSPVRLAAPANVSPTVSTIETVGLTKYFGPHRGLEDLTLHVSPGEVLGFLGPNGSGKTTAIRILMGFLRPTAGRASVFGLDVLRDSLAIKQRVGYLPGDVALYGNRTGYQLLSFVARIRGVDEMPRAREVVDLLDAEMDRPIKKCSRGMRQKIALVLTLAHDPDLLILDEPTTGLDPLAQRALLTLLDRLGQEGKTVFFSSHILSEAEQICDRVAILRRGRLVALSPVGKLREQKYKEVTISYDGTLPQLNSLPDAEVIWQHEGRMTFRARGDTKALLAFLSGSSLTDVSISEPSLEEVFLDYYREEGAVEDAGS